MFLQKQIGVKGKFKFQVFNESGLRYEIEQDNFITPTGLSYPAVYAFADCFRFVSIGSGTAPNSITGLGTTGLSTGIPQFAYIGGCDRSNNTYYATEYCGFEEESNIVSLNRGWRIPTGMGTFSSNYTFQEFMVSPGYPGIKATAGDVACGCSNTNSDGHQGTDGSPIAQDAGGNAYNPYSISICSGFRAFARVLTPISVNTNDFLIVSYKLQLSISTGLQTFNIPVTLTDVDSSSTNFSGNLTGRANQVHHGLKLVWDGTTPISACQQTAGSVLYGESFVGPWGAPMEPSCPALASRSSAASPFGNLAAFVSTDNIQFLVNRITGGNVLNKSWAASNGLGLMDWHPTPTEEYGGALRDNFRAVRQGAGGNPYYPLDTDYTQDTTVSQLTTDQPNFIVNARSWDKVNSSMGSYTPSGRSRSNNISYQFFPNTWTNGTNGTFVNNPIRALTLFYYDTNAIYIPFYDIIFADLTGHYPVVNTGAGTYQLPNENYSSSSPTGYFYGQVGGTLTLGFQTSWSSPCSSGVLGC